MSKLLSLSAFVVVGFVVGAGAATAGEVKDPSYAVALEVPAVKAGQHAVVKVKLQPGAGYHMNKDFPAGVTVTAPTGVTADKAKLTMADAAHFDDKSAEFDLGLLAAAPGKQTVTADLKFAVCSATACEPKREKVSIVIEAK